MTGQAILDSREIVLPDAAATHKLGKRVGAQLARGDVVCLSGGLGAGKTTLARGAIEAWTESAQEVPSPTYMLVQAYDGPRGQLWHFDLYRLQRTDESWELGLEDAFAQGACLIEWPERLKGQLPRDRLDILLATEGSGRRARLEGHGKWGARVGSI